MAYEEYDFYNEPSTGSLKESLYDILRSFTNKKNYQSIDEPVIRNSEGLLSGVLPAIYSGSDQLKKNISGFLTNPRQSIENTASGIVGSHLQRQDLQKQAFGNLERPFQVTNENAFAKLIDDVLTGELGFAPAGITAFHGTPHLIKDKFDLKKVGTGDGGQAYGHGMYFAESPNIAKEFADIDTKMAKDYLIKNNNNIAKAIEDAEKQNDFIKQNFAPNAQTLERNQRTVDYLKNKLTKDQDIAGNLYKVDIPDQHIEKMLHYDLPLNEQSKHVQKVLKEIDPTIPVDASGREIYERFSKGINLEKNPQIQQILKENPSFNVKAAASHYLNANDIKGIKYENFQAQKGKGLNTSNYVVFDPTDTKILERNGLPVGQKEFSVSTRVPTAVKATEDALKENLYSNYKAFRSDQNAFLHNVDLIKQYPNLALKSKNADINAEKFVEHIKDNLLYLHDKVPADTRARSKLWYEGANKIANNMSKEYGISEPAASGILAVLSPQKDWFMNVSLGERVASTLAHKQGFKWDSAMSDVANEIYAKPQYKPLIDAIKGKRLEELKDPVEKAIWIRTYDQANNPREHFIVTPEGDFSGIRKNAGGEPTKTGWGSNNEIAKAVSIFDNPTRENISQRLGGEHKVRNFYMNIYDPQSTAGHTTIDTHAVAAGLLRPLSGNTREVSHNFGSNFPGEVGPKNSAFTGKGGTYGLYHEGYQRAAKEREVLPREMQSITWEAVRGLFPDTFKNAKNAQEIESIWKKHKSGKITVDEAREQILEKAGGINEPEWKQ